MEARNSQGLNLPFAKPYPTMSFDLTTLFDDVTTNFFIPYLYCSVHLLTFIVIVILD